MVFSSMTFLFGFLPIVLLIYYAVPKRVKNLIIMISGLFFYAWGEPVYVLVMLLTIAIDYSAGLLMERLGDRQKKRLAVMIAAVVLNLLFLGIFKYMSFRISTRCFIPVFRIPNFRCRSASHFTPFRPCPMSSTCIAVKSVCRKAL